MDIGILESTGNQLIPVGPVVNWYQFIPVKWTGFNMEIGLVESTGSWYQLIPVKLTGFNMDIGILESTGNQLIPVGIPVGSSLPISILLNLK